MNAMFLVSGKNVHCGQYLVLTDTLPKRLEPALICGHLFAGQEWRTLECGILKNQQSG